MLVYRNENDEKCILKYIQCNQFGARQCMKARAIILQAIKFHRISEQKLDVEANRRRIKGGECILKQNIQNKTEIK